MPSNVVDTEEDESKWERAKEKAEEQGHGDDHGYIMSIYKNMCPSGISDSKLPDHCSSKNSSKGETMKDLFNNLVKLGNQNPQLQDDIAPVLRHLKKNASRKKTAADFPITILGSIIPPFENEMGRGKLPFDPSGDDDVSKTSGFQDYIDEAAGRLSSKLGVDVDVSGYVEQSAYSYKPSGNIEITAESFMHFRHLINKIGSVVDNPSGHESELKLMGGKAIFIDPMFEDTDGTMWSIMPGGELEKSF